MTMKRKKMNIAEIIHAWEAGLLARGEVLELLMGVIDETNIDDVIDSLTPEVREIFIDIAAAHYTGGEMISLRPELDEGPLPPHALLAVQGWLRRHGLM